MADSDHCSGEAEAPRLMSIGELSERTGVPASALRYYDELGLLTPAAREAGRRRYVAAAVREVGLIVFFREIGFSLAEIGLFLKADGGTRGALIEAKLASLAEQQQRIEVARLVLEHGRRCPAHDHLRCRRFWSIVDGRLRGLSIEDSHAQVH